MNNIQDILLSWYNKGLTATIDIIPRRGQTSFGTFVKVHSYNKHGHSTVYASVIDESPESAIRRAHVQVLQKLPAAQPPPAQPSLFDEEEPA